MSKKQTLFAGKYPLYECSDGMTTVDERIHRQHEHELQREKERAARKGSRAKSVNAGQESGTESDKGGKE